jgi:hypothetical protein
VCHKPEAVDAAQRLREFERPDTQVWFGECDEPEPAWQCDTRPGHELDWRGAGTSREKIAVSLYLVGDLAH